MQGFLLLSEHVKSVLSGLRFLTAWPTKEKTGGLSELTVTTEKHLSVQTFRALKCSHWK